MIELGAVNWMAVLAAAAAYFILGGLWFGPIFGGRWRRAIGFEAPDGWGPGLELYIGPLLGCLVASAATGILAAAVGASTITEGASLGLLVAVGYSAGVAGIDAVAPHNARPGSLFLITGSYHLVGLVAVGIIVAVWR